MPRQRISAAVDGTCLATARRLLGVKDSELFDRMETEPSTLDAR
jgi:hypothetical protein